MNRRNSRGFGHSGHLHLWLLCIQRQPLWRWQDVIGSGSLSFLSSLGLADISQSRGFRWSLGSIAYCNRLIHCNVSCSLSFCPFLLGLGNISQCRAVHGSLVRMPYRNRVFHCDVNCSLSFLPSLSLGSIIESSALLCSLIQRAYQYGLCHQNFACCPSCLSATSSLH